MRRSTNVLANGAMAGVLAATALALFFLLVDLIAGEPFRTPDFLAGILLDRPDAALDATGIAIYTVIHYASFVLTGIVVAWLMSKLPVVPGFLLGIVLGFLLFDIVFYVGLIVTGVNIVGALGWPEVLFGNLLAGVVLMGYLHLTGTAPAVTWWETLKHHRIAREGLIAGVLAASAVAVWFFLFDLVAGRPFFTPAALGSAIFGLAGSAAEVEVTVGMVLSYTVLHFAAFILVGLVAAALVVQAEHSPPLIFAFVMAFVTLEVMFIGVLAIFATWLLDTLGWWNVLVGNVIGAVAVVGYLWKAHPGLAERFRHGGSIERPA